MNKSLETEYKEAIRAELPDLWGKIEAKLDAQDAENTKTNVTEFPKAATSAQNVDIKKAFATPPVVSDERKTEPVKRKPKIRWQYFGVIAAAALCMLVVIPALSNMKEAGSTAPAAYAPVGGADSTGSPQTMGGAPAEFATAEVQEETESAMEVDPADTSQIRDAAKSETNTNNQVAGTQSGTMNGEARDYTYTFSIVPGAAATTGDAVDPEEGESETPNADILVLLAVDENTTEEELTQMTGELQETVAPDVTLRLLGRDDADYADYIDPQNDRIEYLIVIDGDLTDEEIPECIDILSRELQQYEFVTVRDIQHREPASEEAP